jgi:hypothetical protein
MSATLNPNLMARAFDWIRARASRDNEMATMSRMDLHYLANDLGVAEADVPDIVARATDHGELLDRMMRARGLNPAVMRRRVPACVRDMEVTCARCRDARVCRRELDSGTGALYCHDFCANAIAMDGLAIRTA